MPVTVKKKKGDKKPFKIVEKSSGRTVGSSKTRKDAEASARIRNGRSRRS